MGRVLIAICTFSLLWSGQAGAEDVFPGALQEVAQMECVPTCLMCHTDNPGNTGTYQRFLGQQLVSKLRRPGQKDTAAFKAVFTEWASMPGNDQYVALIKQGLEPITKQNVCAPSYGCGARFTTKDAAPKSALAAALLLSAVLLARRYRR